MIEILLVSALLTCEESHELVENITASSQTPNKEELIEVIKENTEPECYERPEHNS
tara:strand:- start:151 stop:318 length:168 start_codon:yes stop_codon:yes gene_type:complete